MTAQKKTSRRSGCYVHENVMMWLGLVLAVAVLKALQLIAEDVPLYAKNELPHQLAVAGTRASLATIVWFFPW